MTGVEGYVESTASGFLAGVELARRLEGLPPVDFPRETALGALALYVSDGSVARFQPMNINFGIISPLGHKVLEIIDGLREAVLSDTQPAGEGGERRAQI